MRSAALPLNLMSLLLAPVEGCIEAKGQYQGEKVGLFSRAFSEKITGTPATKHRYMAFPAPEEPPGHDSERNT